jgi:Asp-tRNA(Asn)/Glu-tRNA(Gln) amidotransferase A subunit family amidase
MGGQCDDWDVPGFRGGLQLIAREFEDDAIARVAKWHGLG